MKKEEMDQATDLGRDDDLLDELSQLAEMLAVTDDEEEEQQEDDGRIPAWSDFSVISSGVGEAIGGITARSLEEDDTGEVPEEDAYQDEPSFAPTGATRQNSWYQETQHYEESGKQERRIRQIAEDPVIVFEHVSKDYSSKNNGETHSLRDVSMKIYPGEFVFIIGNSGAGKSTMFHLMLKEISPTSGNIYIAGKNLVRLRRRKVAAFRREIGVVFQDFRLLQDRNVFENVAFAQRVIEEDPRNIDRNVRQVLEMVSLAEKEKAFPNELSGGEQQRVALARALVNRPKILLADEPTGNLDPNNSVEIMQMLARINENGTTVVVVTHNQGIVDMMQKRVIALDHGRIVSDEAEGGYWYHEENPDSAV